MQSSNALACRDSRLQYDQRRGGRPGAGRLGAWSADRDLHGVAEDRLGEVDLLEAIGCDPLPRALSESEPLRFIELLIVLGGVFLAALPEIVRRIAIAQVPKHTGRILQLDDVDLNVFTGHLAHKGVKIQKQGTYEQAIEIERIDVRLDYLPFLFHQVRVTEITVVEPKLLVVRRGPAHFDFSDLINRFRAVIRRRSPRNGR